MMGITKAISTKGKFMAASSSRIASVDASRSRAWQERRRSEDSKCIIIVKIKD
jgi:hypothetical protein